MTRKVLFSHRCRESKALKIRNPPTSNLRKITCNKVRLPFFHLSVTSKLKSVLQLLQKACIWEQSTLALNQKQFALFLILVPNTWPSLVTFVLIAQISHILFSSLPPRRFSPTIPNQSSTVPPSSRVRRPLIRLVSHKVIRASTSSSSHSKKVRALMQVLMVFLVFLQR